MSWHRYAKGGYMGLPADYKLTTIRRYGEYIYTDANGTAWIIQEHDDGYTRTPLYLQEDA